MEKDYSRFMRGSVWFIHFETEEGDGLPESSVMKKSRPYLIVSSDLNNANAPTINAVPIITREDDKRPMHVFYCYQTGAPVHRNQVICCEQVTTLSVLDFNRKGSYYLYTLSRTLMEQVNRALSLQLGLDTGSIDIHQIEELIDYLAAKKEDDIRKKEQDWFSDRLDLAIQKAADRFRSSEKESIEVIEKNLRDPKKMPKKSTKKQKKPIKKKQNRWTSDKKLEFLADSENMSREEIKEKYGISESSIGKYIQQFKKDLA